jgi:glycosyltransferase involved in cell wall biosynthesis
MQYKMSDSYSFTVFTATFNRAHTLGRVYESLKRQTFRDFEWLIVDDGSTDETPAIVEAWRIKGEVPVRYFRQDNAGKHIATNRGVQLAKGELFLNADSDDSFVPHALATFASHWQAIPDPDRWMFSGVCALCQTQDGIVVGDQFPSPVFDATPSEVVYRYRVRGEKWGFVRTDVMRKFPFPEEMRKTYVTENLVWRPIGKEYMTRFINEPLRIYHLDQSGYMRGELRVKYPWSGRQEHLYYLNEELPVWWREALPEFVRSAIHYGRFSIHLGLGPVNHIRSLHHWLGRVLGLATLPAAYIVYLRDKAFPTI